MDVTDLCHRPFPYLIFSSFPHVSQVIPLVVIHQSIWVIKKTVYGLKDSNRVFFNMLKKAILSFTVMSTEKMKLKMELLNNIYSK